MVALVAARKIVTLFYFLLFNIFLQIVQTSR